MIDVIKVSNLDLVEWFQCSGCGRRCLLGGTQVDDVLDMLVVCMLTGRFANVEYGLGVA